MGGKAKPNNNAQMFMEQQQAAEARAREEQRQARLASGKKAIDELYEGSPVMGTRTKALDFSGLTEGGKVGGFTARRKVTGGGNSNQILPLGYSPPTENLYPATGGDNWTGANQGYPTASPTATQASADGGYELVDANGNVVTTGKSLDDLKKYKYSTSETYDTGKKKGGIGEDFYEDYRKAYLQPREEELDTQFGDAKEALTYDLARAGTLASTVATDKEKRLLDQNLKGKTDIGIAASNAAGELRSRVAQERKSLIDQLYATEDPSAVSAQGMALVKNARLSTPDVSSIGRIFDFGQVGQGIQSGYSSGLAAGSMPYYQGAGVTSGVRDPRSSTGKVYG